MSNPTWRQVMGGGFADYAGKRGIKLKWYDGQLFVPYGDDFVVYVVTAEGPTIHVGLPPSVSDWLRDPIDHSFVYAMGMFAAVLEAVELAQARLSSAPAPP